jgi:ornithine cyclodeaminase/alanine dehydrogenase-like protein (mu-crystallin family)
MLTSRSIDGEEPYQLTNCSNDGLGVKITTRSESVSSDAASITSSMDSLALSKQSTPSSRSSTTTASNTNLTIFDRAGNPRALINSSELTAFRTALSSTMLFKKRANVHDVTVFGAGKQAYWHIRLALLLRGPDIHHLNIINRDFERVHHLLEKLYDPDSAPSTFNPDPNHVPTYRQAAGENEKDEGVGKESNQQTTHQYLHRPKIQILTPGHGEYPRLLHATLRSSSVIFLCTASPTPLFPAPILTNPEGRKKGRYISAIGSLSPRATELHPDILQQNVAPEHGHRHFHKHAQQGGAVVVDSLDKCLKDAGEVVQAGLGPEQLVEIGELVMLKRDAEKRRRECLAGKGAGMEAEGLDAGGVELGECEMNRSEKKMKGSAKDKGKHHDGEDKAHKSLIEWLVKGNVIYKSVGLGLTDVVVGGDLARIADERNIGTRIENF